MQHTLRQTASALFLPRRYRLLALLCLSPMGVFDDALAASLGDIQILSSSGEHLQAQVPLHDVTPQIATSLSVSVADEALSQAAGLTQTSNLPFLWPEIRQQADGSWLVLLLSGSPMPAAYNEIIVELSWDDGSYLREYTLDFAQQNPLGDANAVPRIALTRVNQSDIPSAKAPPILQAATQPAVPQSVLGVQVGDSLLSIVRGLGLSRVSHTQAMLAIYRANPDAFAGSPDLLRAGVTLTLPSAAQMLAIPPAEADAVFRQPAVTSTVDSRPVQNNELRDDTVPLYQAGQLDRPDLSSEQIPQPQIALATEIAESALFQQPAAASAASAQAETRITDSGGRAANDVLSQPQSLLDALPVAADSAELNLTELESSVASLRQSVALNSSKVTLFGSEFDLLKQTVSNVERRVELQQETLPTAQANVAATASAQAANGVQNDAGKSSPDNQQQLVAPRNSWKNVMDSEYLRSLFLLGIAITLALLLLARQIFSRRGTTGRKPYPASPANPAASGQNNTQAVLHDEAPISSSPHQVRSATSSLAAQRQAADSPNALSWFQEHLQSSKVSEQAIVKALKRYPNRQDLRLRLMERYANRREVESFAQLAQEMFLMTRGRNKEWPQVVQLGLAMELEMQALEPGQSHRRAEAELQRDISSPFSGDSTLRFSDNTEALKAEQVELASRQDQYPDVSLDRTLN